MVNILIMYYSDILSKRWSETSDREILTTHQVAMSKVVLTFM